MAIFKVNVSKAIEFLVASYKERLEDDGDFIADELKLNINEVADVGYDHDADELVVIGDVDTAREVTPNWLWENSL